MRKLIGLAVSFGLLALLYYVVDLRALGAAILSADPGWLATGLLLVIPLTLATAWRFGLLVRDVRIGLWESTRLVLAASTLNLFLPSKLGDLAKGLVLSERHGLASGPAFSIVILEKALDLLSLLVWGVAAMLVVGRSDGVVLLLLAPVAAILLLLVLLIAPGSHLQRILAAIGRFLPRPIEARIAGFADSWLSVVRWFWSRPGRAAAMIVLSLAIWAVHLLQFWFFTHAVGGSVPLVDNMAYATLSILVGLLPFTLAGIGSRDAAIVYFYGGMLGAGPAALVGILATLRYVIPALAGLPFIGAFASQTIGWRSKLSGKAL